MRRPGRHPMQDARAYPLHVQAGQTVGPEYERDRATVMRLVLHEVPDHPTPGGGPVGPTLRNRDGDVVRRPTIEAFRDHAPGHMKGVDDLGCRPRSVLVILPSRVLQRRPGTVVLATRNRSRMAGSPSPSAS